MMSQMGSVISTPKIISIVILNQRISSNFLLLLGLLAPFTKSVAFFFLFCFVFCLFIGVLCQMLLLLLVFLFLLFFSDFFLIFFLIFKIGDLGLALRCGDGGAIQSSEGDGDGKYVAPEVLGQRIVSQKADVYSLGMSIIELVSFYFLFVFVCGRRK